MGRKWWWKIVFSLMLIALAALASLSTLIGKPAGDAADPLPEKLRDLFPGISLGLDLQGGLRLVYEVQVDAAVEDKREQTAAGIVQALEDKHEIKGVEIVRSHESAARFSLIFADEAERASREVQEVLRDYRRVANLDMEERSKVHLSLRDEYVEETEELAVKQAIETIGNRIDELGLVNTSVVPRGIDIIVEIPGVDERQINRIKHIIGQTARLEFKIVDEVGSRDFIASLAERLEEDGPIEIKRETVSAGEDGQVESWYLQAKDQPRGKSGRQILREFLADAQLPQDRSIGFQELRVLDDAGNPTADVTWRTLYMHRTAGITGDRVEDARVLEDERSGPYVSLSFGLEGARIFEDLTGTNVGRRMAIQLDDRVNSAPTIQERIPGGQARITLGGFKGFHEMFNEARDLVVVLRAGALPAPVKPVTETTIGPQLGQDAIDMGFMALAIAWVIVLVFMIFYYRGAGIAADVALICNAVFMVGLLGGLGATLTLPGIAGIILTIGMAVDANVIIYERIREELRGGKSPRAAVDAGYKRAFWTIFDAQVTTFIAGVVMLQYGTGPIKGFAVTLLIGIVTSMFSAIFVSRLVFDVMIRRRAETMSI